jgi:formylglycine-generating enzyme required for sulfatase activity
VGVSWIDAKAFCEWLTKHERYSGILPRGNFYRLPTDEEWSVAVGLESEPGNTPQEKNLKIRLYPWGKGWPPPGGAGNYPGEESRIGDEPPDWLTTHVIRGYNDGYPRTSPVGSFAANENGLYDMGGNVWQWCEDWFNSQNERRVMRGGSWYTANPQSLLASCRFAGPPDSREMTLGFRCVVARESSR